jgi:dihydrolipoamide dehydrogenase
MLTIGAGYIGMELSTVYAKLGCDVTVVEMLDSVLPAYEDDLGAVVKRRAEDLGVDFDFGRAATDWTQTEDGVVVTTETEDGETDEDETDRVLVAIGREPVTDTLDLSNAGIDTTERGFISTDKNGQTDQQHIYAIGDVAGDPMLAHAASKEGILAAQDIAGEPLDVGDWIVPEAVFTDPEIAAVGMTQAEAEEIGFDPVVGTMPFDASGRAMTLDETEGFVRLVASSDGGALLGAQIVGPEASELVAELTFAIKHRASLADIAETIHVHPTLSEAVMEAAENAMGQAIHTMN